MEIDRFRTLAPVAQMPILSDHVAELLRYNVHDDKLLRGSQLVHLIKTIKGDTMTPADEEMALIGGLVVELMRAWWNIEDDILDKSLMRYGRPCWHQLEKVGVSAVNDVTMMSFLMLLLIQKHFHHHPSYTAIVNYMNYINVITAFGQYLDEALTREARYSVPGESGTQRINWSVFTMDNYKACVELKTGNFDVMSIRLGLYLCNIVHPGIHAAAQAIALKVGLLDQVSDDFIDVFVDENTIGSSGTDIQEAKLSWLVLTALQHASTYQREQLNMHYGRDDALSIARVKDVYLQLDLPSAYREFQGNICKDIIQMLEAWDEETTGVKRAIFPPLFSNIYVNGANLAI